MSRWEAGAAGVMALPSGRRVRGRGLSHPLPKGPPPEFGLYLLDEQPDPMPWECRWLWWPDFKLPEDPLDARAALQEVWRRAETERVEVACLGGRGRTGTALACVAVLDGVPPRKAVAYVREHYHPKAVETLRQRRFVSRFEAA